MRPFDREHLKFLTALNKFNVNYVIIGGHAAIYHGVNALNRTGEKAHLDKYDIEVLKKIIQKKS